MTGKPPNPKLNKTFALVVPGTLVLLAVLGLAFVHGKSVLAGKTPGTIRPGTAQQTALTAYGNLPLAFEPNQGQTDPQVKYLARGNGYTLFLTSREAVLSLEAPTKRNRKTSVAPSTSAGAALRIEMAGANSLAALANGDLQPGVSNYYIGDNPHQWRTQRPALWARVVRRNLFGRESGRRRQSWRTQF